MMYYRRKILLSLLQEFDNRLSKISLQKLLFLFTRLQTNRAFDFVPYKFGCYSFQANYDLNVLSKYNLVEESAGNSNNAWIKTDRVDYIEKLKITDKQIIIQINKQFRNFTQDELIKHTYLHFPYYAEKSTILPKILTQAEIQKLKSPKKCSAETQLFTIGYEGKSFDYYLNQLLVDDIKLLLDVRKNPISMKYGFSSSQLKHACQNLGIRYIHFPDLGINSADRKGLSTQDDYDALFESYEEKVLANHTDVLHNIVKELEINQRVALTCFESDPVMCHRGRVAKLLCQLPHWNYPVIHL